MTTLAGLRQPWQLLARYVPDLAITPAMLGACYTARGRVPG
jgi:hypothetical protein